MRGSNHGSTRVPSVRNAFDSQFLQMFGERDEPPMAGEADVAGPWRVEPVGRRFGLFRAGESPEGGHRPVAVFESRFYALLAAAVLPGIGRDQAFRLRKQPELDGYGVESRSGWGEPIGWLELFDERLVDALDVVFHLVRSPACLTFLHEAAGAVALERTGTMLFERVAGAAGPAQP